MTVATGTDNGAMVYTKYFSPEDRIMAGATVVHGVDMTAGFTSDGYIVMAGFTSPTYAAVFKVDVLH